MSQAVSIVVEGSAWELIGKGIACLAGLGLAALVVYLVVFFIALRG